MKIGRLLGGFCGFDMITKMFKLTFEKMLEKLKTRFCKGKNKHKIENNKKHE